MPNQNPLDTLISNPSQEPIEAPKSASSNPLDSLVSGGSSVSAPVSTPSSNPLEAAFGISNPNNGQTEAPASPKFDYQDPNKPWYSRAFSWLNTPLTESLFGLPEDRPGAGGFERGVEHIASGLTSPLSVALTAATFGTGGLVESAGVTALKEAGLTAAEIADATKASQAALDATRALKPIEPAIQDALTARGHDLGLLQRAREATGPLNLDTQFGEPALQKVLEKAGFSDEERAALAKASDTIIDARQGFKPVEAAVKEAGVDPALWKRAQSALYDQGLTEHDLLGGNMVERGAFQILHHTVPDLPIAVTARAAKTANALLNAGFTLQQFETASAMSPRFLDALKEGDYDKAWEYGTEAFAGGALGVLGASHALHSAGELFKPLIEPDKAMRPSDEYLAIQRANQEREAMHAVAEQHAINLSAEAKRILGHEEPRAIFGDSKEVKAQKDLELASVLNHVVVGGDAEKAATWSDVLAEATGRNEEPAIARPNNGQTANPDVQKLAQDYTASAGIDKAPHEGLVSIDPEAAKRVADAYDLMKHSPDDPKVKASYDALIRETKAQWDAAKAAGYTLEPWDKPGQPYANSKEMADDVRNNKHLYYFQGGEVPEGHPLGQVDPETGETYNNIFRAVHDLFGHAKNGYEFGPRGEENAFLSHSKMYSDEAIPAMLSETKAQNSWVNFGKHLRDEKGNVPIRGEKGYVPQTQRPYAEQKAGILPAKIVNPHLSKEPQVGTPVETPSRAGTQVVHSNDAGEVRVGADGRPVVWLSPEAWEAYNRIAHPGNKISGVSYSPDEAADISKKLLKANEPGDAQKVLDLFWKAQDVSKQSLLTAAEIGTDVTVAAEELQHTHQRELAQDGEIRNLFKSQQWSKLSDIIPITWTADMDRLGYDKDPITRVAETAAQFRSGKAAGIVPDTDITRFLDSYYSELEANYGKEALESADRINEIAAQHVKDIYENRRTRQTATEGGVANQATGNRQLSGLETGRETGAPEVGPRKPQTGLTSTASNRPDIRRVFHWSRQPEDFEETNPSLEGTGVRGSGTSRPYIPGTYFGEPGYQEPAVQGNAKKFYADLDYNRVYNAENDPLGLAEKAEAASKKSGKGFGYEYEKLIQDSGYEGYRNQGVIKYFKPVKVARDFSGLGLAARGSVSWDQLKPYLGDDVTKHDTEEKQAALTAAFNTLPDSQDYREAIKAGRAGQMWYERSSRAFDALLDSGFDFIKPKDKTKFLNFVAALSPVQPVRQNLLMALNLWSKWDKAGRPTDVEWKNGVPNKNASLWRILKGRGQTQGVDLPARMNNAIRALQGEPLSGPKVSAFTTNLGKDVNRVTNDTWMAVFGDQDPNRINKPAIYDAMSAKVREAAKAEGIAPRQAQAAVWSFIKSLAELSGWGNDRWIPPQEIIKQGLLTPELVGMHSADFADMLQNDPEIRDAIKKIGGDLNALDTKLKTYVPGKPATGEAAVASPELLNAAGRLEAARSNSRIAAHLARKQEPGLFDTEFRPNNGLFAKDRDNLAPTWYLKSNQLIDSRMSGPMPADTVLKMLENNGVKPDELKYTGLQEFLKDKGKEPVRPEELRQYLAANNLQIQEVTYGGEETPKSLSEIALEKFGVPYDDLTSQQQSEVYEVRYPSSYEEPKETQFGVYTLPGGNPGSYRELVLSLPEQTAYERDNLGHNPKETFRSSHFPEPPNPVGHVRFNDRTGPNGEKLLHLEELQSDWHQKGRTQGYNTDVTRLEAEYNDALRDMRSRLEQLLPSIAEDLKRTMGVSEENAVSLAKKVLRPEGKATFRGTWLRVITSDPGYQRLRERADQANDRFQASRQGVPDAPFKKTWPELLMKRMIRYASENGYDGISWTPGEEQAARYDLSKQLDSIRYAKPDSTGGKDLSGKYEIFGSKDGGDVLHRWVSEEELPDFVGKDVAKRIISGEGKGDGRYKALSGVDLKVGGEGMKGFYDKIVPEVANKLGKQFGSKVRETDVSTLEGEPKIRRNYDTSPASYFVDVPGGKGRGFETEEEAKKYVEEAKAVRKTVPYFPITDSMRESVLKQGQPLFSRERPNNGLLSREQEETPEFKAYFKGSKVVDEEGKPKIVYHGTNGNFSEFKVDPNNAHRPYGFYFTDSPGYAGEYTSNRPGDNIIPAYIRITNPASWGEYEQAIRADHANGIKNLQAKGYDGVVANQAEEWHIDNIPDLKKTGVYVAFDPEQIKSAIGNRGTFERGNPNILFSRNSELDEQIRSNVFKNQPKEYQDLVLESLRRVASGELSDRERAAAKFLRDEQDKNFEIGSSNDLLHSYIDDYMTRVYKDTNPQGRVILSDAKGGKFATNVSMAKQRVYDSNLTALLKSPKQMLLDPVDITARGRAMLIKAAANRQLIDTLRDKFTRASDGRPAVVLSGQGQVVSGANGEDPKTFIDPNRVRKINIDPKVVDQLTKSGDLQRFLDDGTIRDITPYVHPNNIQAAIERLEEQSTRKEAQYDQVGNNKLLTQIMYLKSMLNNKDFSGLKDFNDKLEKNYAWDPQDYISLAHNAMKGWNFVTNSPDGNAVFVRSDIKVHPEFAEYLKNRLGLEPSDIAKHPIGKALLGAGTKLKQTLLSLSPFHMVQEALRGIMVGVNPFHITGPDILSGEKVDPSDPNSPTIIRKAVEHGFTTGTDYKSLQEHSEGVSAGGDGLLSKIPGVGKTISNSLDFYQSFLFKRYIPALKARSVELMFHEYQRLHPEWSVDKIAKAAAQHTNDTFGGVNWKAMGRSATTQDWGRLLLLAPDWLESEMRSGARLFNKEEGGLGRAQVAKMALGLWGIARVLNLVTTGNAHYEAPFGLAVKNKEGKETVFSIRTLPTDLLHAASDPVGFVQGRLSPVVRTGTELVTQRDQFGRKLQPQDLWADAFRQMAPIPLQAVGQAISGTGPQIGNIGQAVKAVGGTAQTYQTPAQKLAADLASSHTESGPIDPAQMARHSRVIQLEDQARAGEISWPDLYKLAYQTDQISESELKKIQENVKATHGMDASMASLFSRASRLPAKEFLDLWDVTNPSERAALAPLVSKVQKRYLTKAKKEMTPEERAKDPVFQRLIRMIPPNPMQPQQQ